VTADDDRVLRLRSEELAWRQVGEEIVALDIRANSYLSINHSGIVLWEMLAEGSTKATMTARMVSDFGVDEARAGSDVEEFVAMLAGRGLLG
jgi:hypothetical protein